MIETANILFAIGAVMLQIAFVITLAMYLIKGNNGVIQFVSRNALLITFLLSLAGIIASLFYSQIAGYAPCTLCWWQRIFMYPQALIAFIALQKKDSSILSYLLPLSIVGIIFALYHMYIFYGGTPLVACDLDNPCNKQFVNVLGYLTIPSMSLTLFGSLILTQTLWKKNKNTLF